MSIFSIRDLRASAPPELQERSDEEILAAYAQSVGTDPVSVAQYLGYKQDSGKWGSRFSAATDSYQANLYGLGGAVARAAGGTGEGFDRRREANELGAQIATQRARDLGAVDDWRDVTSLASGADFVGGLAAQSYPYALEALASGLVTRGLMSGSRAALAGAETVEQAAAARRALNVGSMAGAAAVSYPSAVGDVLSAQRDAGGEDLMAAGAGGVPYAALNAVGVGGLLARGVRPLAATDGPLLGRIGREATKTSLAEGAGETGQELINQSFGRMAVDPTETLFNDDANRRYLDSFIGGAALGGVLGGAGGLRSPDRPAPSLDLLNAPAPAAASGQLMLGYDPNAMNGEIPRGAEPFVVMPDGSTMLRSEYSRMQSTGARPDGTFDFVPPSSAEMFGGPRAPYDYTGGVDFSPTAIPPAAPRTPELGMPAVEMGGQVEPIAPQAPAQQQAPQTTGELAEELRRQFVSMTGQDKTYATKLSIDLSRALPDTQATVTLFEQENAKLAKALTRLDKMVSEGSNMLTPEEYQTKRNTLEGRQMILQAGIDQAMMRNPAVAAALAPAQQAQPEAPNAVQPESRNVAGPAGGPAAELPGTGDSGRADGAGVGRGTQPAAAPAAPAPDVAPADGLGDQGAPVQPGAGESLAPLTEPAPTKARKSPPMKPEDKEELDSALRDYNSAPRDESTYEKAKHEKKVMDAVRYIAQYASDPAENEATRAYAQSLLDEEVDPTDVTKAGLDRLGTSLTKDNTIYSMAEPGATAEVRVSRSGLMKLAEDFARDNPEAPRVVIADNPQQVGMDGPPGGQVPSGAVSNGTIYLFRDGLTSQVEAEMVLTHELFHNGLENSLPQEQYYKTMMRLQSIDPTVKGYAIRWKQTPEGLARRKEMTKSGWDALAVEEALADVSEDLTRDPTGKKYRSVVRNLAKWMAEFAQDLGLTRLSQAIRRMTYTEAEAFVMRTVEAAKAGRKVEGALGPNRFSTPRDTRMGSVSKFWEAKDKDRTAEPSSTDLRALTQAILRDGVKEPITITVSTASNTGYVTDGNNRLAASKQLGLADIPYRVVLTDVPFTPEQQAKAKPVADLGLAPEELVAKPKTQAAQDAEAWLADFNGGAGGEPEINLDDLFSDSPSTKWSTARGQRQPVELPKGLAAVQEEIGDALRFAGKKLVTWGAFSTDLASIASKALPSVQKFTELMTARDVIKSKNERAVEKILQAYDALPAITKGTGPNSVNTILREMTTTNSWGFQPDWLKQVQIDPQMASKFNSLPDEAQNVVREVLRHGHSTLQQMKEAVLENVTSDYDFQIAAARTDKDAKAEAELMEQKAKTLQDYNSLFRISGETPYAPLKRFGNHVVLSLSQAYLDAEKDGNSKLMTQLQKEGEQHYAVMFAETNREAKAIARRMAEGGNYALVDTFEKDQTNPLIYAGRDVMGAFYRLRNIVEDASETVNKQTGRAVNRLLNDIHLTLLGEQSARQSERNRKNIAGADPDMMRAFATQGRATAHFIASLYNNGKVYDQMRAMKKEAGARTPGRGDREMYYNEFAKRFGMSADYQPSPIMDKALGATSVWMLLSNPSYYLQNSTQPFMMSLPVIGAKHGYAKTWREMGKAYRQLAPILKDGQLQEEDYGKLPNDVRDAIEGLVDAGRIDISLDQDLGRWRSTEASVSDKAGRVVEKLRTIAQTVESINRLSTAMAAYRLESASGASQAQAQAYADKVIYDTHGDYSGFNAPRITRQGGWRLVTQFKKFQLIQLSLMAKLANQAFKGASPEERMIGKRALGFTLAHAFAVGGTLGLPGATAIGWVLGQVFGDDDEPVNPELTLRRAIGDPTIADILLKGVPKAAGVDLSGKLGMGNMLSILPYTDVEVSRDGYAAALTGLLGPFLGGLMPKAVDGIDLMSQGRYYEGAEKLLPTGLGNALRGARFTDDGMQRRNGELLLSPDEITFADGFMVALGLPTTKVTNTQFLQATKFEYDQFFKDQTNEIRQKYVRAYRDGDNALRREAMEEWSALQQARRRNGFTVQPLSNLLKAPAELDKRSRGDGDRAQGFTRQVQALL